MSDKTKNAWVINGLLAVILLLLVGFYFRTSIQTASAAGGGWETDGVMAISSNLTERLVLVDTAHHNFMVYRIQGKGGKFTLMGARSYQYDVEMEDTANTPDIARGVTFLDAWKIYQSNLKKP